VKRFLQLRTGGRGAANRHAPERVAETARFRLVPRAAIDPDPSEIAVNPRARSARLRIAERLEAPAGPVDRTGLGLPATVLSGAAG